MGTLIDQDDTFPSFLSPNLGLPTILHPGILSSEEHSTGRQASTGCSDIYSVFAFLAFLFALLDFLLNMMENRKKRGAEKCGYSFQHSSDKDLREGTLAVYAMLRGMLNSIDTLDGDGGSCSSWAVCEAAGEAGKLGRYGMVVAVLGSSKAGWTLEKMGRGSRNKLRR